MEYETADHNALSINGNVTEEYADTDLLMTVLHVEDSPQLNFDNHTADLIMKVSGDHEVDISSDVMSELEVIHGEIVQAS